MKNNSSVSFINTNTMRSGADYDANVAAAMWDVYDKKNNWNVWGKLGLSQLFGKEAANKTTTGYNHNLGFGKFKGRFNFNFNQEFANDKYDQNDLGYFTNNNYLDHSTWLGYKWVKPGKWYNRLNYNFSAYYSIRYKPAAYQNLNLNTNLNGQLKNLWQVGANITYSARENDFYEPRQSGYVFKRPQRTGVGFWVYTNDAKKYSTGVDVYYAKAKEFNSNIYNIIFSNQFRFNKRLTVSISNTFSPVDNNIGFTTIMSGNSIIAIRDRKTVENLFNIKYNFTNKMGLTFRARHYWSKVENKSFYNLSENGDLTAIGNLGTDYNYNINFFNIDMVYTWQFGPGSFINVVWKNIIASNDEHFDKDYFYNAKNVLSKPQDNNISIKVIYFLDYLTIKKKHK